MQARGPLMIEHRLIERMLSVIKTILLEIESTQNVDLLVMDIVVDFIHVYADRTHHGKEEEILFRKLVNKPLSNDDRRVMNELIEEHMFGRMTTKALVEANTHYRNGDESAFADIASKLQTLIDFYPRHIEKEDHVFFQASRTYFTDDEEQTILAEFREFDQKMIHEKYTTLVEMLEG